MLVRERLEISPIVRIVGSWEVAVAAIVGLVVGVLAARAYFMALAERHAEDIEQTPDVTADEATMLGALSECAVVVGLGGEVLRANTQSFQFGLVRTGRLAHQEVHDMVHRLSETGEAQSADLELKRGPGEGGSSTYLSVVVAPLARDRALVLGRDQTGSRRLDQTRRDFVANISHELKTPVGAMGLLAETVAECADEPEVVAQFSEQMKREAARLAQLVQEIIDLSRLQEPDALADSELVAVDDVVAEAVDRARIAAQSRSISIITGGARGLDVFGDHGLLVTAVRNLLDNAVQYSPDGTAVSLGVRATDGMVRISVVDQGIGIAEDAQLRVFERFFRVDEARSRRTGGTGLGLSIVKHIAADHGGEVTVWSKPGRGSTFTLVIPQFVDRLDEAVLPAPSIESH